MSTVLKNMDEPHHEHEESASVDVPPKDSPVKRTMTQAIWEVIAEIGAQIPEEEWEKVPSDASINYKHYLYGVPKKTS